MFISDLEYLVKSLKSLELTIREIAGYSLAIDKLLNETAEVARKLELNPPKEVMEALTDKMIYLEETISAIEKKSSNAKLKKLIIANALEVLGYNVTDEKVTTKIIDKEIIDEIRLIV